MNRLLLAVAVLPLAGPAFTGSGMDVSTTSQQVAENGLRPLVSPDGQWIAFGSTRDGTPDLYLSRLDGSSIVRLTRDTLVEGSIAWSGDAKQVWYSVYQEDSSRLYSVRTDGTARTEILRVPGRNPLLSPDGKRVIYAVGSWQNMQVFIANRDGSNAKPISPAGAAYYNHRFSPDGSQIAASRSAPSDMQVWLLDADGRHARPITRFAEGRPQAPAWSPDGKKIAVQGVIPNPQERQNQIGNIWVVDVQTGEATKLAEHAEPYLDETPSWFPDGKRIAFQSNRTGRWEVWVMNADGTGSQQLTR